MTNVRVFRKQDIPGFSMSLKAPADFKRVLKAMGVESTDDLFHKLDDEDIVEARRYFASDRRHRLFTRWFEKQWRDYERIQEQATSPTPKS